VCAWHEHHQAAQSELARWLRDDEPMLVAGPALVETYGVLTRLPPPHRLIETSFVENERVVALEGRAYRVLLARMAAEGIAGGRASDAVIAECTLRERGVTLLTFNADDFAHFASRGLAIIVLGR
jgi:predicted nucleic acid-binding protein